MLLKSWNRKPRETLEKWIANAILPPPSFTPGEPLLGESAFCRRNKHVCGRGERRRQESLSKDSPSPPSFPTALQAASRWWDQITTLSQVQLALTGAGWLGSMQGCRVTLSSYFSKNQAVLREWALIRPALAPSESSLRIKFSLASFSHLLHDSLIIVCPGGIFSPRTFLQLSFKTQASRAQKLKQPYGLISALCFPVVLICYCGSYVWMWSLVKVSIYMVPFFNLPPLLSTREIKGSQYFPLMVSGALVARCKGGDPNPEEVLCLNQPHGPSTSPSSGAHHREAHHHSGWLEHVWQTRLLEDAQELRLNGNCTHTCIIVGFRKALGQGEEA